MKQNFILVLAFFALMVIFVACNTAETKVVGADTSMSSLALPYVPMYSPNFDNNVSDSELLLVLNSYKYWETGDLTSLRSTMGDSMSVNASNGFKFKGLTDSLMNVWTTARDSMSSVAINVETWVKIHSLKDTSDYVNVWYKEIDTYKTGRVDSANFADVNAIKDGKIVWFSQYKQQLK